ncbi:MAG: hypothetical protein RIQ81_1973 [Pseudomonadota bacterium]
MKTPRKKLQVLGVYAVTCAQLIGCGSKKKSDDTPSGDEETVNMTGQLQLGTFPSSGLVTLAETALKGWILFDGNYSKSRKPAVDVTVGADGTFSWDAASSFNSKDGFGVANGGGSMAMPNITAMLTTYTKSGDPEAEAASMKFVGLPAGPDAMTAVPTDSLTTKEVNFGAVSASSSSSDAKGDQTANSSMFDGLSDAAVLTWAGADDALKTIKNAHMNDTWGAEPFYLFTHSTGSATSGYADANGKYSGTVTTYTGAGFYVGTESANFSFADVCPSTTGSAAKIISLTAPSAVNVNGSVNTKTVFDNSGTITRGVQGGYPVCTGEMFYVRDDSSRQAGAMMLNFAAGGGITSSIPDGIWRLKFDSVEVGRFDLAISEPRDENGKVKVFTVQVKHTESAANTIQKVEVKFFRYDSATSSYIQVTDMAPVKKLISELTWDGATTNGSQAMETLAIDDATGIASATLSTPFNYGANLQASSISYKIGTSTYRFEFRP